MLRDRVNKKLDGTSVEFFLAIYREVNSCDYVTLLYYYVTWVKTYPGNHFLLFIANLNIIFQV